MKESILKRKKIIMIGIGIILVIMVVLAIIAVSAIKMYAMSGKDLVIQSNLEMSEVGIISQTSGQIIELNVKEGDYIKEGDIIARVDSETLKAQREKAQAGIDTINAQINAAQAQYKNVKNGTREEELAQVKASYDLTKTNYDRIKTLYENGAVSKMEYDNVSTQLEVAAQKLQLAQKGATVETLEAASANVDTLEGQLKQAQAALKELDTYLGKTEIIAPATGVITQLNVDKGELVSGGMSVATITDTSAPWIQCNVMENELEKIALGKKVKIELTAYPNKTFDGEIVAINKSADFAVKRATNANGEFDILSYGIKVKPLNIDKQLFAGMTAFVNFGSK